MTRIALRAFLLLSCCGSATAQFFAPDQSLQRGMTRVTWLGMSGEQSVAIDYGQPAWRAGHEKFMQEDRAQYARLGVDAWTTLQTNVDLAFGDRKVPRGRWYVGAHRDQKQNWTLTLLAADKADAAGRGAGSTIDGAPDLELPMRLERVRESVDRLSIELSAIRPGTPGKANILLSVTWGTYRLRAELTATFDTRNPEGAPKFVPASPEKQMTTDSGLQYEQLRSGVGPFPKATDKVRVHYVGWLADGTQFDSSYRRGEPVVFPLAAVVKGFAEGLQLMQPGATFRLCMPPELAYGAAGAGNVVPPNSTLVFTVTLLGIEE